MKNILTAIIVLLSLNTGIGQSLNEADLIGFWKNTGVSFDLKTNNKVTLKWSDGTTNHGTWKLNPSYRFSGQKNQLLIKYDYKERLFEINSISSSKLVIGQASTGEKYVFSKPSSNSSGISATEGFMLVGGLLLLGALLGGDSDDYNPNDYNNKQVEQARINQYEMERAERNRKIQQAKYKRGY